jgi:branched-chain amino acid transport system substrate-binding protein
MVLVFVSAPAAAQQPIKVGVVTFLSGAAAGPFGVPAKQAADIVVEALNAGGKIPGYGAKGLNGVPIELVYVDEAGGTTKQVTEYRNLAQRADVIIGYISSGDCLAVAPVADELKKLTIFFDCGTPRVFEDASYKYLFRTGATSTMDSVAAAFYVNDTKPNVQKIAGINQNYAWGQDSWNDFLAAMKVLKPNVQVATVQWPQ